MECNKDEAKRAMDIAQKKLSESDYVAAKKFVNKAHSLYPELDGLKQVLAMINVYVSAANKINGVREADWYGVLGVDPLADDEAVKKQYKTLALLLHPDKNKFNGAEGAFKLVSEAWCLLSDKAKRVAYDQKRKLRTGTQKPPNQHKPASANSSQNARAGVDPSAKGRSNQPTQEPPKQHKPASNNGNQNARAGVDPSAKAGSNQPTQKPPNPHKPASFNGNQNARAGVDPSAKGGSNQPTQEPPKQHKPASFSGNQNARAGVDPSAKGGSNKPAQEPRKQHKPAQEPQKQHKPAQEPPKQHKPASNNGNQNARAGVDPSAKAGSNQPTQKPPNPHKPASFNLNQNARAGVDPSANAGSNQPSCETQKPSNQHKAASFNLNQNARAGVDPSAKARSNQQAPVNSSKGSTFWAMCVGCKSRSEYRRDLYLNKAILCPNCGQTYTATEINPWESYVGATQATPQASAKSQATNRASSSGRVSSATPKTPQVSSFVWPGVNLSSSRQQQWSAKSQATNKNTNGASSFGINSSSATQETQQAQERLKRPFEELRETLAALERLLNKKLRTDVT